MKSHHYVWKREILLDNRNGCASLFSQLGEASMNDVREYLLEHGIIPLSPTDGLVSLVDLILGPGIKGNWWGQANSNAAYNAYAELADDPDIIVMKLVDHKVTLVHRNLWNCLFVVALDAKRLEWRKKSLSPKGLLILSNVDRLGTVGMDFVAAELGLPRKTIAHERKKLEQWGVVLSKEEHTKSGHHDIVLQSWKSAALERNVAPSPGLIASVAYQEINSRIKGHRSSLALP